MRRPLALLLLLASAFRADAGTSISPLSKILEKESRDFGYPNAIVVEEPASGFRWEKAADEEIPSASLFKLMVMVEAYRQVKEGELDPELPVISGDSAEGVRTPAGVRMGLMDAIQRMIIWSDNGAALGLVQHLGGPRKIDASAAAIGLRHTRLNYFYGGRTLNTTSAGDMALLFRKLLLGEVVSKAASDEMLHILSMPSYKGRPAVGDRLPRGLPDGARLAHKTGDLDGILHDAGVLWTPTGARIIVVLTHDLGGVGVRRAYPFFARLAEAVYHTPARHFASMLSGQLPALHAPGCGLPVTVSVSNASSFDWSPAEVFLSYHLRAADGAMLQWDGPRFPVGALPAGATARLPVYFTAPQAAGDYRVEWEVVIEGVAWSGDRLAQSINVSPHRSCDDTRSQSAQGPQDPDGPASR